MQWLNKLDGVIDSVLLPRRNRLSTPEEEQLHDFEADEYYTSTTIKRHEEEEEEDTNHGVHGVNSEGEYRTLLPDDHDVKNDEKEIHCENGGQCLIQGVVDHPVRMLKGNNKTILRRDTSTGTGVAPFFPRPGMIRPVLREHDSDDSSFSDDDETDDNDNNDNEYDDQSDSKQEKAQETSRTKHINNEDRDDVIYHDDHTDDDDDLHSDSHVERHIDSRRMTTPKEIHTFQNSSLDEESVPRQTFEKQPPPKQAFPKSISLSNFSKSVDDDYEQDDADYESDRIHDALIVEHQNQEESRNFKDDTYLVAVQSVDISRGSHDSNGQLLQGECHDEMNDNSYQNQPQQEQKDQQDQQQQQQQQKHMDTEHIQQRMDPILSLQNDNVMDITPPCLPMDTLHQSETVDSHEYDHYDEIEQMQATFGDFLPGSTFQEDSFEDDNDDDMSASTSMTQREGNDYILEGPLSWEEDADDDQLQCAKQFEPSMNCHGIVHVRLLRVQHLPCSKGSSLQATFSLPPWKGRIRSEKVVSYRGPSKAGICARWDVGTAIGKEDHVDDSKELLDADFELRDDDNNEQPRLSYTSMVHAYNNEETPVPTISIELKDMALMFERNVCFLNLSCLPLMRQPGVFRRRWCPAKREHGGSMEMKKGERKAEEGTDQSQSPLCLVEACFEPTEFGESKSSGEVLTDDLDTIAFSKSLDDGKDIQHDQDLQGIHQNHTQQYALLGNAQGKKQMTKKRLKSNPHMFRNYSSLRPTYCALCNTMIAWKLRGYQCEVCKLDCCADCQLRVDVEMPCGSEKALDAVKKMSESKLTLSKIYEVIAPKKVNEENSNDGQFPVNTSENEAQKRWKDGVGTLTLRIKKACLFRHNFPPEADLDNILEVSDRWLRSGDYYARVSWTDGTDTKRTKTVFQTAKPRFDSDDIVITSSHYGTEFKIEVVDATTDMPIGTKLLTTQGLLQWQRDNIGWGLSLSSVMNEEPISLEKLDVCLELRANVKTGFGIDFYNSSRLSENARAGEISGWIELDVLFRENPDLYSFSNPRPCPPRPTDDFNVELIQLHIARITAIVDDIWSLIYTVSYIISWKNPALTSLSLLIFIAACLRLNSEYIGSFPFAIVIIFMLHTGRIRKKGAGFRVRLLKKETEAKVKEMIGNAVKYKKHRPVAELEVAVLRGRNLAPNHRIPGSLVASIFWEPSKFADEYTKNIIKDIDPSLCGLHQIGETEGSGMTSSPEWLIAHPSNELERMKQLLPSKNFLSRTNSSANLKTDILKEIKPLDTSTLTFPILQPISAPGKIPEADLAQQEEEEDDEAEEDNTTPYGNIQLVPWESSKGAIVIQVRFADVLNKLPIFDQVLGEVVIPLARLAKEKSIEGWFKVLEKGTMRTEEDICNDDSRKLPYSNKDATDILNRLVGADSAELVSDAMPVDLSKYPSIFLQAKLKVPNTSNITDIDKETSRVIAEHLIRSTKAKEDIGLGFIGTSISTFNTVTGVRGNVQNLQNQLGKALDMIEIFNNLFNFTCPEKSGIILIAVAALWFVFVLIPTRYIILIGGLAQYTVTFKAAFSKQESSSHDIRDPNSEQKDNYDPILTRMINFFTSVPTNEDLRRYYFWEAVKVGEVERELLASKKRAARLTKLWKAQWFGKLELKVKISAALSSEREWEWKTIFCIIQGHRFIWWESEKDFDEGENPSGQIYFAGHSGLAGLSPLELRELKPDEVPLVVNIFGRGASRGGEQTKLSLLTQDLQTKQRFEASVLNAVLDKND